MTRGVRYLDIHGRRWRALRRTYQKVLRRAAEVGWHNAKAEHMVRERELGRPLDDVRADVAMFEQLNAEAWARRIDPVSAQLRRDLYERRLRPSILVLATLGVALAALRDVPVVETISGAVVVVWLALNLCKALLASAPRTSSR
jgi:hypothetical protein